METGLSGYSKFPVHREQRPGESLHSNLQQPLRRKGPHTIQPVFQVYRAPKSFIQKLSLVQCHEPQGSRPGFIVLSSDSVDNLRSTFSQLQRCFSTLYTDILEMDDDQHALIKKLKDIYRKVLIAKSRKI